MLTAWSYFDSLKARLKSTATGVLRGHKNYSFWCSLNEAALVLASPQFCRLLRQLGIRLTRPEPTVNCPWPRSRRVRRLREIQRLIDNLATGEVVLYLDEVDIHLNPKIGPQWTQAGKQKYVRTPGCNEKRYLAGRFKSQNR